MNITPTSNLLKKTYVVTLEAISVLAIASSFSGLANAATVKISSYNIIDAELSGFGYWAHEYNGKINYNGYRYDYSDGSGTLNDGVIGTGEQNTQLFDKSDYSVITAFLNQKSKIANIKLFSFGPTNNVIPGNIDAVDITINGKTQTFSTIGFGPKGIAENNNGSVHELINFSNSIFANVITDKVYFSNFQTSGLYPENYGISEIVFEQTATSVPEPLSLGGVAVAGAMGFWIKRKQKISSTV